MYLSVIPSGNELHNFHLAECRIVRYCFVNVGRALSASVQCPFVRVNLRLGHLWLGIKCWEFRQVNVMISRYQYDKGMCSISGAVSSTSDTNATNR